MNATKRRISLGRHKRQCSICCHPQREQIEADFIAWRSPVAIAKEYGLSDRASMYRHAHALELFPKRQRNILAALEKIIEQAGEVDVTAAAVVAAVQAYSKINAAGQWVDRTVNMNELFARMTPQELDTYARCGALPRWFTQATGATGADNQED